MRELFPSRVRPPPAQSRHDWRRATCPNRPCYRRRCCMPAVKTQAPSVSGEGCAAPPHYRRGTAPLRECATAHRPTPACCDCEPPWQRSSPLPPPQDFESLGTRRFAFLFGPLPQRPMRCDASRQWQSCAYKRANARQRLSLSRES